MKPEPNDCERVSAAAAAGRMSPRDESHLFVCRWCRRQARLSAAWKSFAPPEELETALPVDESFVRAVLARVREDRRRRARKRVGLAAAAALLFFFAAGAAQRISATVAAGAEESYAQLLTPALDSFLPK